VHLSAPTWPSASRPGTTTPSSASGGYGTDELDRAGAFRVYEDPGDLLRHLDEVGIRELE
jgi:hypothetical protein